MRTSTQQTLDTCITPADFQNGGFIHVQINSDGHAHTAWLSHTAAFVELTRPSFDWAFFACCYPSALHYAPTGKPRNA